MAGSVWEKDVKWLPRKSGFVGVIQTGTRLWVIREDTEHSLRGRASAWKCFPLNPHDESCGKYRYLYFTGWGAEDEVACLNLH